MDFKMFRLTLPILCIQCFIHILVKKKKAHESNFSRAVAFRGRFHTSQEHFLQSFLEIYQELVTKQ